MSKVRATVEALARATYSAYEAVFRKPLRRICGGEGELKTCKYVKNIEHDFSP
jgi:hypothetical protein